MKKNTSLLISLLGLVLYACESSQNPQHSQQQQDSSVRRVLEYNVPNAHQSKELLELESKITKDAKEEPSLLPYLEILHRKKRSSNDIFLDQENDLDEILAAPSLPVTLDLESLPPVIRYLVKQKLKEQRSRMTPRLGRDIEDDDCQRPRPPFAPRLGRKSVPFKPRLGRRQVYDDTTC